MKFDRLFGQIEIKEIIGEKPLEITDVTDNSKDVAKGGVFFAVGGKDGGEKYVLEAERRGAAAIVSERPLETSATNVVVSDAKAALAKACEVFFVGEYRRLKIVGVVGTNGKTTVCRVLHKIFEYAGIPSAYCGTLGNGYGDVEEASDLTTMETVDLYKFIGRLEREGIEYLFMELSAHAIAQRRAEGLFFECLVFTNCSEDHLDYFGDFEKYAETKKSVFKREKSRYMAINSDDAVGMSILSSEDGKNAVTYGIYNPADVFAIDVKESVNGISFIVNLFDIIYDLSSPLVGLANVYNLLAALATASLFGVKIHTLSGAVKRIGAIEGRTERLGSVCGGDIFLDFAHTPDGLKTTLNSMRKICDGRLYCLFGCGGNREKEKREIMGEIAGVIADFSIITSDNPRFEDPSAIISEIERGIRKVTRNYITIEDRREAIGYAARLLKEGDVLVVCGKGAEKYQEVMGSKKVFSDAEEIRKTIEKIEANLK